MNAPASWFSELPLGCEWSARAASVGYVYVIEFSLGTVKVGQTTKPRSRFRQHQKDAEKFGGWITQGWLSAPHAAWLTSEQQLIRVAHELMDGPLTGVEYFTGEFAPIVAAASYICESNTPPPTSRWPGAVDENRSSFDAWHRRKGALSLVRTP